jgi:Holliday junction resolvase-like predicted endonuclease
MYNKNFRKEPTEKQKIGQIGEDFACEYLKREGYRIIDRNYLKKWGEIDIVLEKNKKIHFVEVKTVSDFMNKSEVNDQKSNIFNEKYKGLINISNVGFADKTKNNDFYRAEDNMHPWKLQRLGRAIQSYLLDKNVPEDMEWQLDLATVHLDANKGLLKVMMLPDIVL